MKTLLGIPLLAFAGDKSLQDGLSFSMEGAIIVLIIFAVIGVMLVSLNRSRIKPPEPQAIVPSQPASTPPPATAASETIPPETRAAIAAAIFVTETGAFRIVKIQTAGDERMQAWSIEGRRQIFHSHQIR